VLAADVPGNAVRKYDPQSLALLGSFNLFQAAGAGGNALAVDAAGNVYVAETALAPIVRFDANGVLIGQTDCVVPGNTVACAAIRSLAFSDDGVLFAGTSIGYLFALQPDLSSGFSSAVEDGEAWPPGDGFRVAPLPVDAIFVGNFEP
jgi:outer membrane protein assembly factor BamB